MSQPTDAFAAAMHIKLDEEPAMSAFIGMTEERLRDELIDANRAIFRLSKLAADTKRRADYLLMALCFFAGLSAYLAGCAMGVIK